MDENMTNGTQEQMVNNGQQMQATQQVVPVQAMPQQQMIPAEPQKETFGQKLKKKSGWIAAAVTAVTGAVLTGVAWKKGNAAGHNAAMQMMPNQTEWPSSPLDPNV